ncbi:putative RNA-binding protein with TRAM domain [Paenibacillus anaericanus]|uniref:copper amine oxidase N-terminal domain-containing protein n=1 Tax=Paenibacillus anaericanus TaxID=170367 RepID=UPI00278116A0|nr:copper amine oxidase N-terminal domain-containing protein [Paenibacillus anaericanus]MDQ0089436.1 putative RNA-binding protein with TRAM domain [Paenibacillus anaericanus]
MKKLWVTLLAGLLVLPILFQSSAQAATPIRIYIDGVPLVTDQAAVMIQGRTMLPLRAIFEALDAKIQWNQKTQTVTAIKDDTTIVLKIGSKVATINNKAVSLDVPGKNLKGRTMVPVRFVGEALGQEVGWNSKTQTVTITSDNSNGGNGSVNPVSYVTVKDVGDAGDGRDLQVSFSKSTNESLVDHYRVLVVKAANTFNFNLSDALRVSSANYSTVLATGADPVVKLTANSRDVDGNLIGSKQAYVAYVLAVGKANNASALSSASSTITLDNVTYVAATTDVKVSDVNNYGDGRDLSISFTRPSSDSNIASYRVLVVKTKDISKFDLAAANNVSSQNYTTIYKSGGSTQTSALTSSSRDTSGELIKSNVPYTIYVLSVSSNSSVASNKLSSGSSSITLSVGSITSPVITAVEDINDYGDGRDLRVSFTKLSDESKISSYRIFVVKASDYGNFNLTKANAVSSSNYTQVNKTGSNISQVLSSGVRDIDGVTVRNGVSYRVFVMAIGSGNNAGSNELSSASQAITLLNSYNVGTVSSLYVSDVNDYGDGRDLRVSYTRASEESNISSYRIMVVPTDYYSNNFSLSDANNVSSSYYTTVSKGYNYNEVLSSNTRDVRGNLITSNKQYRVYVLSVSNGSYSVSNALSSSSSTITLMNGNSVGQISNLDVEDIADNGDGRDLRVSFNRASDESNISHYRILVVPTNRSLSLTQAIDSSYFTQVSTNGNNSRASQVLLSSARDVNGTLIKSGVDYRVHVLSVGYSGNYALSSNSSVIKLATSVKTTVLSVTDVTYSVDNKNNITVSFTKSSSESNNISEYRVLLVPSGPGFGLNEAITSSNYVKVDKGGTTLYTKLSSNMKDINNNPITTGKKYLICVLAVANSNGSTSGALAFGSLELEIH